jgi:hypothetical protein
MNNMKYLWIKICNLRYINFSKWFYWNVVPGQSVIVKWPSGWAVLYEDQDGGKVSADSSDPNDHYRPWLEKHVGRQGIDWQWDIAPYRDGDSFLEIKVRFGKMKYASMIAMMWS